MTTTEPELDSSALTTMITRFARSLSAEGLAGRTARLETKLSWPGSPNALFVLEAAMTAAWPNDSERRPTHELIWVTEAKASAGWVKIRAFDAEGRLLLDRRYGAEPARTDQCAPAYARG
jgi:hypothetical protein